MQNKHEKAVKELVNSPRFKVDIRTVEGGVRPSPKSEGRRALLPISVGMEYHEGKKFDALIDDVISAEYTECDVLVGCTLQRHNYFYTLAMEQAEKTGIDISSDELKRWIADKEENEKAERNSRVVGDNWCEKHEPMIQKMRDKGIIVRVIRWDDRKDSPDYLKFRAMMDAELKKENGLKNCIGGSTSSMHQLRLYQNRTDAHFNTVMNNKELLDGKTVEYIKEETTVMTGMAFESYVVAEDINALAVLKNTDGSKAVQYDVIYPVNGHAIPMNFLKGVNKILDSRKDVKGNLRFCDAIISKASPQKTRKQHHAKQQQVAVVSHKNPSPQQQQGDLSLEEYMKQCLKLTYRLDATLEEKESVVDAIFEIPKKTTQQQDLHNQGQQQKKPFTSTVKMERAEEEMGSTNYRSAPPSGTLAQNAASIGMFVPEIGRGDQKQGHVVTPTSSLAGSPTEDSHILDKAPESVTLGQ